LMKKFPAIHAVQKYKDKQKFWCEKLDLQPTSSVHNCYCDEDLYWYSEHRMLVHDGLKQNVFSLIPLLENHDLLVNYLATKN